MEGINTSTVETQGEMHDESVARAQALLEAKQAKARERIETVLELFAEAGAVAETYDRGHGPLSLDDDLEVPVADHANARDARRIVEIRRRELEN